MDTGSRFEVEQVSNALSVKLPVIATAGPCYVPRRLRVVSPGVICWETPFEERYPRGIDLLEDFQMLAHDKATGRDVLEFIEKYGVIGIYSEIIDILDDAQSSSDEPDTHRSFPNMVTVEPEGYSIPRDLLHKLTQEARNAHEVDHESWLCLELVADYIGFARELRGMLRLVREWKAQGNRDEEGRGAHMRGYVRLPGPVLDAFNQDLAFRRARFEQCMALRPLSDKNQAYQKPPNKKRPLPTEAIMTRGGTCRPARDETYPMLGILVGYLLDMATIRIVPRIQRNTKGVSSLDLVAEPSVSNSLFERFPRIAGSSIPDMYLAEHTILAGLGAMLYGRLVTHLATCGPPIGSKLHRKRGCGNPFIYMGRDGRKPIEDLVYYCCKYCAPSGREAATERKADKRERDRIKAGTPKRKRGRPRKNPPPDAAPQAG